MSHAAKILIECCDELMVHVGYIKNRDPQTPATRWAPLLDRILDTRSAITRADKELSKIKPTPMKP